MNVESSAVKKTKIVKNLLLDNAIENFNLGVNTSNAIIGKDMDNLREENARLKEELNELEDLLTPEQEFILKRQNEDKLTNKKEK